jgi:DedD protein
MMERALKERIIGAAVLVLVVVLVVPVFLDGPPPEGAVVSERVPLPGQANQETRTVVLERDRSSPVPANESSEPAATTPQPQPAPVRAATQSEPEPTETQSTPEPAAEEPAPQPAADSSSTGMWAVQLGSFGNADNAERLAADLRSKGHAAFLSQVSTSAGQRHRVRIGPQKDRAAAEAVAAKLREAGHEVKVLPHP